MSAGTEPARLLERATTTLEEAGVASPRHDAEVLLAHVSGRPRLLRDSAADEPLDGVRAERFEALVARRAAREPLQHLLGSAPFRYLELLVGPGVFVPRPETEAVAGWAIDRLLGLDVERPVVVDLCTGSGAIAAAIAQEAPEADVHAVELDPAAHAWAERNLAGSGVDLRLGDMSDAFAELDGRVDVVVANPPYIPLEAWESVEPEVRDHDPALALWSGDDGLDATRVLERTAARLLRPGGGVATEHAEVQTSAVPQVFLDADRWDDVRDHPDLAGRQRFTTATRR